ncbi:DNA-3-methyladenine glycosylase I [Sinobacterium caligoides]|uniref:DNA-3-methyladenine glycosylase I n=1 Tax=Sinobacterium caligoides TaxID=933926 RepID=A0A3N2DNA7_9GAMM|nr:DNA-3-methyladenine glycosylase I [Sinobacterium caligoides]ROS01250.1 DNA-3-methyladenine glycosylase I [Sinobacterium caligoides]
MQSFASIYQQAADHHGGKAALDQWIASMGYPVRTTEQLAALEDRYMLAELCRRVFRTGIRHAVVDAKWPAFEQAFFNFSPMRCAMMSDEELEGQMQNEKIIRHLAKIVTVRENANMVVWLAREHGSFARFIADWPAEDIISLWDYLKKHGKRMGGNSGARFLRMVGKDSFVLTDDVVVGLRRAGVIDKHANSKRDRAKVQEAFNSWAQESGLGLAQMSRILACSIG